MRSAGAALSPGRGPPQGGTLSQELEALFADYGEKLLQEGAPRNLLGRAAAELPRVLLPFGTADDLAHPPGGVRLWGAAFWDSPLEGTQGPWPPRRAGKALGPRAAPRCMGSAQNKSWRPCGPAVGPGCSSWPGRLRKRKGARYGKREQWRQYGFVIQQLTSRELKRKYARSVLGVLWSVLNPLLSMGVLSLIFSQMFRRSIENYPIYYLTGYLLWQAFTATTNTAMTTLADNRPCF